VSEVIGDLEGDSGGRSSHRDEGWAYERASALA
jgi:hypothetical protein